MTKRVKIKTQYLICEQPFEIAHTPYGGVQQAHRISVSKFITSVIVTLYSSSYIQNIFLFKTQSHLKITILLGRKILLRSLQVYTQRFLPLKTVCTSLLALETVPKVYQLSGSKGVLVTPSHYYIQDLFLSAKFSN